MSTIKSQILFGWSCVAVTTLVLLVGCADSRSAHTDSNTQGKTISFEDVTEEAGLATYTHENGGVGQKWMPEIVGPGVAFIDYDGDSWEDILIVGGGVWSEHSQDTVRGLWLYGIMETVRFRCGLRKRDWATLKRMLRCDGGRL